jgi:hypothetical protein
VLNAGVLKSKNDIAGLALKPCKMVATLKEKIKYE